MTNDPRRLADEPELSPLGRELLRHGQQHAVRSYDAGAGAERLSQTLSAQGGGAAGSAAASGGSASALGSWGALSAWKLGALTLFLAGSLSVPLFLAHNDPRTTPPSAGEPVRSPAAETPAQDSPAPSTTPRADAAVAADAAPDTAARDAARSKPQAPSAEHAPRPAQPPAAVVSRRGSRRPSRARRVTQTPAANPPARMAAVGVLEQPAAEKDASAHAEHRVSADPRAPQEAAPADRAPASPPEPPTDAPTGQPGGPFEPSASRPRTAEQASEHEGDGMDRLRSEMRAVASARAMLRSSPARTLAILHALDRSHPDEHLREERTALRILALAGVGRFARAAQLAEGFVVRYPHSAFSAQVQAVLNR